MTQQQFVSYAESSQKELRRFLTALCCGDAALADDLAQDTLVKAYLSCDGFRDDSKFTTWMYRIAYNTFISHHRSYKPSNPLDVAADAESDATTDTGFDYQGLYLALDRLSDKERSAILLHYMQGYSTKEIAEITGSTTDAVKALLSRGRKHLKTLLEEK